MTLQITSLIHCQPVFSVHPLHLSCSGFVWAHRESAVVASSTCSIVYQPQRREPDLASNVIKGSVPVHQGIVTHDPTLNAFRSGQNACQDKSVSITHPVNDMSERQSVWIWASDHY